MDYIKQIEGLKAELRGLIDQSKIEMTEEIRSKMSECSAKLEDYQLRQAEIDKATALLEDKEEEEYRAAKVSVPETTPVEDKEAEYRTAFDNYLRNGVELRTVTDYQNLGVEADGGYLAPADFYNKLVLKRDLASIMRKAGMATVINIDRATNIPVEGSDATASWVAEGGAISATKQAFASVGLIPRKLVAKIGVTEEMLADSKIDLASYIGNKIARLFVSKEETAFIKGTAASNQPVGILSSGITTTRTAAATAVTADDLVGIYEALGKEYIPTSAWIISPALEAVLIQLTTGTGGFPLWQPSYQVGVPNLLFGRPVYVSSDLDTTIAANKYQAIFGDFSYYYIGDRKGYSLTRYDKRDVDGRFDFLGAERIAGALTNNDAIKILQCKAS